MSPLRPKVLHVEDQPAVAAVVRLELERAGFDVLTVPSGEECLVVTGEVKFDLILLDESLPGMDGLELCRRLKADLSRCHLPIVFFSGNSDPGYRAEARLRGAADYLLKGDARLHLTDRIKAVLTQAQATTFAPQLPQWINVKPRPAQPPSPDAP